LGAQHRADGVAAKSNQVGQQMTAGSLKALRAGKRIGAGVDEGF